MPGPKEETYELLGIPLTGMQAEMGKLIANQLRYEMAFKQLRVLHRRSLNSINYCSCGDKGIDCETRRILNTLEDMNGLKL